MVTIAKWIILGFGIFIIMVGFLMLLAPKKANRILRMAGSTNFINYAEITVRMIPAAALIIFSDHSKYPQVFKIFGWFMLFTSIVLYFIPRQKHHRFSLQATDFIKPFYFQLISPFAFMMGAAIIYSVV
jgi:uncharacterized membrane protein YfcA